MKFIQGCAQEMRERPGDWILLPFIPLSAWLESWPLIGAAFIICTVINFVWGSP